MMRVSYVRLDGQSRVKEAIGPLEKYIDAIVKVDKHHRRALVKLPLFGEERTIKFCLWLDTDPKVYKVPMVEDLHVYHNYYGFIG